MQIPNYSNHVTTVLGHRGSGKSTWLSRNLDSYEPFILIDPLVDQRFQDMRVYRINDVSEGFRFFKEGNPRRVCISPNLQCFDFFCGVALAKRGMTVVIDEVDNYTTSYFVSPNFDKMLRYGRHRQTNIVMVARRPKDINKLLRSQTTRFIIFPLGYEESKELADQIGEAYKAIPNLKCRKDISTEYLDYDFHSHDYQIKTLYYKLDNTPIDNSIIEV